MAFRLGPEIRARRDPVKINLRPATDHVLVRLGEVTLGVLPLAYIFFKFPPFGHYAWFPPLLVPGALAFALAVWITWHAHKDLGRSFSRTLELRPDHKLVTNGIYRYIRHPIYSGFLMWCLAQALLLPNWVVGLAAPVIFIALIATRIPREERMMTDEFGDEYRDYMKRSARLIPGVF